MYSNHNINYTSAFQYPPQNNYPHPPPYPNVNYVPIPVQTDQQFGYQSPSVIVPQVNPYGFVTANYPPAYPGTNLYPQMAPVNQPLVNTNQGVISPQRGRPMSPPVQRVISPSAQRPTSPAVRRDVPEVATSPKPMPTIDQILAMNHTKRCKRCSKYYKEDQSIGHCKYHPGGFRLTYESSIAPIRYSTWSCCSGMERESPGCKQGDHIEDRETTAKLQLYDNLASQHALPIEETGTNDLIDLSYNIQDTKPRQKILKTDKIVRTAEHQEFIKHNVRLTDTISGLSLKYKVSSETIKRVNRIRTDKELWTRPEIKIPIEGKVELEVSEEENDRVREEMKRRLINRFRRITGTKTEEEARYYLETNDYNFDKAVAEHKQDIYWQANNPASSISKKVY